MACLSLFLHGFKSCLLHLLDRRTHWMNNWIIEQMNTGCDIIKWDVSFVLHVKILNSFEISGFLPGLSCTEDKESCLHNSTFSVPCPDLAFNKLEEEHLDLGYTQFGESVLLVLKQCLELQRTVWGTCLDHITIWGSGKIVDRVGH